MKDRQLNLEDLQRVEAEQVAALDTDGFFPHCKPIPATESP